MNQDKFDEMIEILNNFRVNGIRPGGKSLEPVLRFQDLIGRSTKDELKDMWSQIDEQMKKIFIWAVTSTCGFEMASSVIEYTLGEDVKKRIQKQFEAEYQEIEEQTMNLCNKNNAFEEEKRQARITQHKQNQILAILEKNN